MLFVVESADKNKQDGLMVEYDEDGEVLPSTRGWIASKKRIVKQSPCSTSLISTQRLLLVDRRQWLSTTRRTKARHFLIG